jgi:hypothetical protein
MGRRSEAVEAGRHAVTLLEETRSGERWRGHWALGAALAATTEGDAACDALRRAVALLAAVRDDLPADDAARRAAVTRARAEPARALVRQLRALGRDAEAGELARQWAQPPINPALADA